MSVIIATYNREQLLERAVRSCLAQTFPAREVLVCDDGSTDGSEQRIKSIDDPRVKWVTGAHTGRPAVPRNRGVANSSGNWLAFLDDDDSWRPEKLAKQFEQMAQDGTNACCTNASHMRSGDDTRPSYFDDLKGPFSMHDILPVNKVICSSVLINRKMIEATGGFPEAPEFKALEDYALWLRVAAFTNISYCPEPLVEYLDAPNTSIRSNDADIDVQRNVVLSDLWEWNRSGYFDAPQKKAVARALRGARRGAGRPITEWMFVR